MSLPRIIVRFDSARFARDHREFYSHRATFDVYESCRAVENKPTTAISLFNGETEARKYFSFFSRDLPSRLRLLLCLCFLVDLFAFIKTNGRITTIRDANFRYASAQLSQAVIDRSSYAFPRSIVSASGEERHRKTSHFFFLESAEMSLVKVAERIFQPRIDIPTKERRPRIIVNRRKCLSLGWKTSDAGLKQFFPFPSTVSEQSSTNLTGCAVPFDCSPRLLFQSFYLPPWSVEGRKQSTKKTVLVIAAG